MGGDSYGPYGDSPYGPPNPKHSVRGIQRSSLRHQLPETLARAFENDDTVNAGAHHKHRPAQTPSTSNNIYPPRGPNSPYMVDRMYDWSLYAHDRNHGNDLPTLRKKKAALEAQLEARSREGRPYDENDHENAQAVVILLEIRKDIARLEGEGRDGGGNVRDGRGERTSGMDFSQNRSSAGGRAQREDTHGHGGSSGLPKRSNDPAARHHTGSGHASRREMTEDDIAPITRDFAGLGVRSRESGKTPHPPRHHDFEDHAGEASRGHGGSSEIPKRRSNNQDAAVGQAGRRYLDGSGHTSRHEITEDDIIRNLSNLGVRSRKNSKTPRPASRHQDSGDLDAAEAAEHQSRRPLSGRHQPSASHGRSSSGRFADHESGAPSRRQNSEHHAEKASEHQSRRPPSGRPLNGHRHQPSATGHGRSSGRRPEPTMWAPPWRHQTFEDLTIGEPNHQPRGSRHGRHPPPAGAGHGRSSSGHFAADHDSSR